MNFKNLFLTSFVFLLFLLVGMTSAQQAFYVNNQTGSDGYNGFSATWTGGLNGPKATLGDAIQDAPGIAGSPNVIYVQYTGDNYTVEPGSLVTINKAVTISSLNATSTNFPIFVADLVVNYAAGVTFMMPIQFRDLTLTAGIVTGASNITISRDVTRTLGSVDSQLKFTNANHSFTYNHNNGTTVVTDGELILGSNTTNFFSLTTTGNSPIRLNEAKTMNGILNTSNTLDLNTFQLTIKNTAVTAHTAGGTISNGTLRFDMDGNNVSIDDNSGSSNLPNIIANRVSGTVTLTIDPAGAGTIGTVGNIETTNTTASIIANNTGNIGNVTLKGSGTITTNNANGTVALVEATSTSTGTITLNHVAAAGTQTQTSTGITQTGRGLITYGAAVEAIQVNGNVLLNTAFTFPTYNSGTPPTALANLGLITFTNDPTAVTGSVTNDASFDYNGTNAGIGVTPGNTNLGVILFQCIGAATNFDVTLGSLVNSTRSTGTLGAGGTVGTTGMFTLSGEILFDYIGSDGSSDFNVGAVTNSSTIAFLSTTTPATNQVQICGNIRFTGVTNVAGEIHTGAILNSSASTNNPGTQRVGDIDFGATGLATVSPASILSSGVRGGDILFGLANISIGGGTGAVSSTRTAAAADIIWPAGAWTFTSGTVTNSGASNITVGYTGTVTINGNLVNSLSGTTSFGVTGSVTVNGYVETSGTGNLQFPAFAAGSFIAQSANFHNTNTNGFSITGTGTVVFGVNNNGDKTTYFTSGLINFGGPRTVEVHTRYVQIGGNNINPSFAGTNANTVLKFMEIVPNYKQEVLIGNFNPRWPGDLLVANAASIPAPVVEFYTNSPGNLYVLGGQVEFNATGGSGTVYNSILLNGARIYVGMNAPDPDATAGNFQNWTGYLTQNDGRVVMYGNAGQAVNNLGPVADLSVVRFGDFEISTSGGSAVNFPQICTFNGFFYLSWGTTNNAGNIRFQSPGGVAPFPTIVRSNGSFNAAPDFGWNDGNGVGSFVNVVYIGNDATTSWEIPQSTIDKLWNLSIETTTSATNLPDGAGKAVVQLGFPSSSAIIVNGTLNIIPLQTLLLNNNDLVLRGEFAVIDGYITNLPGGYTDRLILDRPLGTHISGSGTATSIHIGNNSVGNILDPNFVGLYWGQLGTNGAWGGAADNVPPTGTANGGIVFLATGTTIAGIAEPAGPSSITVGFAGAGPHMLGALGGNPVATEVGVTMSVDDDETLTFSTDCTIGNFNAASGVIDLGGFTLTNQGTTPTLASIGEIVNGNLQFVTTATNLTVTGGAGVIDANVLFNAPGGTINVPLTNDLTINGNVTLMNDGVPTAGTQVLIPSARTLTLGSAVVEVEDLSNFTTTGGTGSGVLLLDVAAPTLYTQYITHGNSAVRNLTLFDNVMLDGGVLGTTLSVVNLIHTGGYLDFANTDINVIGTGASFLRNGPGTYVGDGFLIWSGTVAANFNQSSVPAAGNMIINNFRTTTNLTLPVAPNGILDVVKNLEIQNSVIANSGPVGGPGFLFVGDPVTPNVPTVLLRETSATNPDITLFALQLVPGVTQADYVFTGNTGGGVNGYPVSALVWPAAPNAWARNVTVSPAATTTVTSGFNRIITTGLNLLEGTLAIGTTTLTLNSGVVITRDAGGLLTKAPTGTLDAVLVDLVYTNAVGNTDIEYQLPGEVNDFTIGLPSGSSVDIAFARTITGVLTMHSTLNINANTSWTLAQTIPALSIVNNNAVTDWNAGLVVDGTYTNALAANATTNAPSITGTGTVTNGVAPNIGTMVLGGYNVTGLTTLGAASLMTMSGPATFAALTLPGLAAAPPATVPALITTPSDLAFNGAFTNNMLNLNFTGAVNQLVTLVGAKQINNLSMLKTANTKVMVVGANVVLNPVQIGPPSPSVVHPSGVLTLNQGVLEMGNHSLLTPPAQPTETLTIQATTTAGIITNLGFVRPIPWSQIVPPPAIVSHVYGRLGVYIPAGTIGRTEWPVGSASVYRPAALTFTAGNATIAPTSILVSAVDYKPAGVRNFGTPTMISGTKYYEPTVPNVIGSPADFYWLMEATTPLGASQRFDVELNGVDIPRGVDFVYDTRIIRRYDGDAIQNGWFVEGTTGGNALYLDTPMSGVTTMLVRNIGALGSAIAQRAIFTIGIPSQKPVWAATYPATDNATEDVLYTRTFLANDLDVGSTGITYTLVSPPAGCTINPTTGVLSWTPGWTQGGSSYAVLVHAAKNSDATSFVEHTITITVANVNRAPSFTVAGASTAPSQEVPYGNTAALGTFLAIDPDGQTCTYTIDAAAITAGVSITGLGVLNFNPTIPQVGNVYIVTVTANDGDVLPLTTTAVCTLTVKLKYNKGDVTLDGARDVLDALAILKHVVHNPDLSAEALLYADVNNGGNGDGTVGALDAAAILYYNSVTPNAWPLWKSVPATGDVEFGKLAGQNGTYALPINLSNTKGVTSFSAEAKVGGLDVNVNTNLPKDWVVVTNTADGVVRIAAAGLTPLSDGTVASLNVKLNDKEQVVNVQGSVSLNDEITASLNAKVREIPSEFALSQNYPNPFNPTTSIKYALAEDVNVSLIVYDMLGREVRRIVDGQQEAGFYNIKWDGTNEYGSRVASGVYIYRLQAGSFTSTIKMNLMK